MCLIVKVIRYHGFGMHFMLNIYNLGFDPSLSSSFAFVVQYRLLLMTGQKLTVLPEKAE